MEMVIVSDDAVRSLPDMQTAIRTCILYSGHQLKYVACELGLEQSHLSKMVNPSDDPRHFPPNKLTQLMDVCGNDIPARWLAYKRGLPALSTLDDLLAENARLKLELELARQERGNVVNVFKTLEVP